jgi:hypothetical protein
VGHGLLLYGHRMALPPLRAVPPIPGWITSRDQLSGDLTAVRTGDLTGYQREHGCTAELRAAGPRELEALCLAASAYEVLLDRAELVAGREAADRTAEGL